MRRSEPAGGWRKEASPVASGGPADGATYNFTAHSFLRLIGQRVRADNNPALSPDPVDAHDGSRTLSALYAYKLNWQTVLYRGYGTLDDLTAANAYVRASRNLFVKVSYAWQR